MTTGDKVNYSFFSFLYLLSSRLTRLYSCFLWFECDLEATFVYHGIYKLTIFLEFARESTTGLSKISRRTQSEKVITRGMHSSMCETQRVSDLDICFAGHKILDVY